MKLFSRLLTLALFATLPLHAESQDFGRFGAVALHRPPGPPSALVLFLAKEPGSAAATRMAAALAAQGALVAVIDLPRYLDAARHNLAYCSYPSADLERLGRSLAKKLDLANLPPPFLAGDTDGSGLAYAAFAQAPPATFSGLLTAGFCPLHFYPRPLCGGNSLRTDWDWKKGGNRLRPEADLDSPWVALAAAGPACEAGSLQEFAAPIHRAVVVPKPAGGEEAEIREGFAKLVALHAEREKERAEEAKKDPLPDLPLIEAPAPGPASGRMALLITGDGGYVGLDNRLGNRLSKSGLPVVALDSLNYFWKPRTPESVAADLTRILDHYFAEWKAEKALLLGYSQGADVLPFAVEQLPERLREKVIALALVGPDSGAIFDFQFGNFMAGEGKAPELPVAPQIARVKGVRTLCFFAEQETDSLCRKLPKGLVTLVSMPGGHGYSKATDAMVTRLLAEAEGPPKKKQGRAAKGR